jgi:hypothetical protein
MCRQTHTSGGPYDIGRATGEGIKRVHASWLGGPDKNRWAGTHAVGDKNITFFGRNAPQIAISIVVPPFWSSCNLTGESDVRGKAGSNWVRKIFNCLRSL